MNVRDLMRMEFIGMDVEVLSAPYSGVSGVIVDETKNTFTIDSAGTERMVPKPTNKFRFTYEGKEFVVKGKDIQHRPEDRIKKVR